MNTGRRKTWVHVVLDNSVRIRPSHHTEVLPYLYVANNVSYSIGCAQNRNVDFVPVRFFHVGLELGLLLLNMPTHSVVVTLVSLYYCECLVLLFFSRHTLFSYFD